jgi:hypothetical protein
MNLALPAIPRLPWKRLFSGRSRQFRSSTAPPDADATLMRPGETTITDKGDRRHSSEVVYV